MALIIPTPLVKPTDFLDYRLFMIAVVNVLKNYQIGNLYMTNFKCWYSPYIISDKANDLIPGAKSYSTHPPQSGKHQHLV